MDAATGENAAVTLIADAVGSIRIPADKSIVLDLNGNKLTGAVIDGKMQDVVTNDGALTVRDSAGRTRAPSWVGLATVSTAKARRASRS